MPRQCVHIGQTESSVSVRTGFAVGLRGLHSPQKPEAQ